MDETDIQKIVSEVVPVCDELKAKLLSIDEAKPNSGIALKVASSIKKLDGIIGNCEAITDECNKVLFDAKIKEMLKTPDGRKELGAFLAKNEKNPGNKE